MPRVERKGPRWGFFRPFYSTRQGQIMGLATRTEPFRDGLAAAHIGRHFPMPEYPGIVIEPSRSHARPAENMILIGSSSLFVDPKAHSISGSSEPWVLRDRRLATRLKRIEKESCFGFEGEGSKRVIVNRVTGERFSPRRDEESGITEDYALVRRVFRGPFENTILLEGVHRLGTLGAAKVVTNDISLTAIDDALRKLDGYNETQTLEIIVRAKFHDDLHDVVYSLESIRAQPLLAVFNRQWVFDLAEGQRWKDQMPWDLHLCARGGEAPLPVTDGGDSCGLPRVELEADLRQAGAKLRKRVRNVLLGQEFRPAVDPTAPSAPSGEERRLLRELVELADLFRIVLVREAPISHAERHEEIHPGSSPIRRARKQFFIHLALCRILGCALPVDQDMIREHFPGFSNGNADEKLRKRFLLGVPGKMRDAFGKILGPFRAPRDFLSIQFTKTSGVYVMQMKRAGLVLKLRV